MIIGTAGHIDHGKTSLVRLLTGVDTDRLKEEKARGISIDLGFAYLPTPDGSILGFVDVPGHEKFIHNMLAGATGIDYALLIVAADDGIMPQTQEHLAILDLLGVTHGAVALTKIDVAEAPWRERVAHEITQALSKTNLANAQIFPVSSQTGEGVDKLREHLFEISKSGQAAVNDGRFRLAVDRSFTLQGAGTVVTGTVLSGSVRVGDRVQISPSGLSARIRSIHAQNRAAEIGVAGQRCALNLAGDGIVKEAISRGDVILDPELHAPTDRIDATVRILPSEQKAIGQWHPVRFHHAASEIGGRIVLLGDEPIAPGADAKVQLVLDKPIAAAAGDRFVIRDTTAQRTIGGGKLIDLRPPSRKRKTPERLAQLDAFALSDPAEALAALLESPAGFADLTVFARDRALSAAAVEKIAEERQFFRLAIQGTVLALDPAAWLRLQRSLEVALTHFHAEFPDLPGIGLERLRISLKTKLPAPAFLAVLQNLARSGKIGLDGAWVRLAGHEVKLLPADEQLWNKIVPMISAGERFRPPRVRDISGLLRVSEPDVRRLLKLIARMGKADEVAHDHFFLRDTVAEMVEIAVDVAQHADQNYFTAAQFRDRLDNGRKVAIQILEFFDRHGVTLRKGDLRRMNKHRLDLFRRATQEQSDGREASPVGRPDFKSGKGREPVFGGFDSHSLPPNSRRAS